MFIRICLARISSTAVRNILSHAQLMSISITESQGKAAYWMLALSIARANSTVSTYTLVNYLHYVACPSYDIRPRSRRCTPDRAWSLRSDDAITMACLRNSKLEATFECSKIVCSPFIPSYYTYAAKMISTELNAAAWSSSAAERVKAKNKHRCLVTPADCLAADSYAGKYVLVRMVQVSDFLGFFNTPFIGTN
jgi:hypothetical protein